MSNARWDPNHRYRVSARVMITAVICLFFIVLIVVFLHLYARRKLRRRAYSDMAAQPWIVGAAGSVHRVQLQQPKAGLDPSVLESMPVFTYRSCGHECTVCLSGIEEGEMARFLPNCKHYFHLECIDMWLHSHSTCPVCRTDAEPRIAGEAGEVVAPLAPATGVEQPNAAGGDVSTSESKLVGGSSSSSQRLSSFRRMLSRERSSRRMHASGQDDANVDDIEKQ